MLFPRVCCSKSCATRDGGYRRAGYEALALPLLGATPLLFRWRDRVYYARKQRLTLSIEADVVDVDSNVADQKERSDLFTVVQQEKMWAVGDTDWCGLDRAGVPDHRRSSRSVADDERAIISSDLAVDPPASRLWPPTFTRLRRLLMHVLAYCIDFCSSWAVLKQTMAPV